MTRDVGELPNIVLIMTDQHRAGFTAGEGFGLDTMPFLDSLAEQGTRFTRAYTTLPACVPARCSLLTGRFPKAHRVRENHAAEHVYRGDDLIDVLRGRGYRQHFAGKTHFYRRPEDFDTFAGPYWHTRLERRPSLPESTATLPEPVEGPEDQFLALEDWLTAMDHGVAHQPTPFGVECQFPYRIVNDAITALESEDTAEPFFSWLSFPEPHNPYQVPEPYFSLFDPVDVPERLCGPEAVDRKGDAWVWLRSEMERKRPGYDDDWRRYRANYCGMLRLIDDQIQRFVDYLQDRGVWDNTILIFVSDHGDYVGDYGLQRKGAGMPECLMRVPLVITGPGIASSANTDDFVSLVDLLPTICEVTGAEIPFGVQGRSLWPILNGQDYPSQEFASIYAECGIGGAFYGPEEEPEMDPVRDYDYAGPSILELNSVVHSGHTRMLRRDDWKLIFDSAGRGELYDLSKDPAELTNRYDDDQLSSVRETLLAELLQWTIRTEDEMPQSVYRPKRTPHNWSDPISKDYAS